MGQGLRYVVDLFDTIVGKDQGVEFVKEREVIQFTDLIITQIYALEEVQCGTHVLDMSQFVSSQV